MIWKQKVWHNFFLSVYEVIFSYICWDSAQFCQKAFNVWNGATHQKVNFLSVQFPMLHRTHWMDTTVVFCLRIRLRQSSSISRCFYHGKTSWASQKIKKLPDRSLAQGWGTGRMGLSPVVEVNWLEHGLLGVYCTLRSSGPASWRVALL